MKLIKAKKKDRNVLSSRKIKLTYDSHYRRYGIRNGKWWLSLGQIPRKKAIKAFHYYKRHSKGNFGLPF